MTFDSVETHCCAAKASDFTSSYAFFDGITATTFASIERCPQSRGRQVGAEELQSRLFDGRTATFDQRSGWLLYMMKLCHLVEDKIHARAASLSLGTSSRLRQSAIRRPALRQMEGGAGSYGAAIPSRIAHGKIRYVRDAPVSPASSREKFSRTGTPKSFNVRARKCRLAST